MNMEIRNALKKIDNYLSVVQNLNRTILEEGTMAPDELKLMKKYLRGCIERIEDIEAKLNIAEEPETAVFTAPEAPVAHTVEAVETEIVTTSEAPVTVVTVPAPVAEQIIIDPEQSRTVSQLVADTPPASEPEPVISFGMPEVTSSTIVETESNTHTESMPLVAAETADVPVIAQEEKRSWADLWEEAHEPVNNGLVAEAPEPLAAEAVVAVLNEIAETPEAPEEPARPLVAEDEPESSVVGTIVEFSEETTLNEVLQTRKETGLFEMFSNPHTETPAVASTYTAANSASPVVAVAETDVMVAEIETPQPEFSLSSIFSQVRTPSEERTRSAKTLSESIALNDKFIFVRELFGNQFNEYEHALRHLDGLATYPEAEQYCRQYLEERFRWNERVTNAEKFYALLDKRFSA